MSGVRNVFIVNLGITVPVVSTGFPLVCSKTFDRYVNSSWTISAIERLPNPKSLKRLSLLILIQIETFIKNLLNMMPVQSDNNNRMIQLTHVFCALLKHKGASNI